MGNVRSSRADKEQRTQIRSAALEQAKEILKNERPTVGGEGEQPGEERKVNNQQVALLGKNDLDVFIHDVKLRQLDRNGADFTKNDLIAIAAKLTGSQDTRDMIYLHRYTVPDLRAAIRISIYTPQSDILLQNASHMIQKGERSPE